jgi:hypothetical protein
MQIRRKVVVSIFALLIFAIAATGQEQQSIVARANGNGTITLGKEQFKLYEVVVKLFENGSAELNLISDIQVFVQGSWARTNDPNTIDLKITGSSASSLEGGGKLLLRDDHKSIAGLKLQMSTKTSGRTVKVDFTAK